MCYRLSVALCLCLLMLTVGCGQRKISHGYRLEKFIENGKFYIHGNGSPDQGVFEGVILELGWGDQYLIALVDCVFDGDPDGWYFLNMDNGAVAGPLHEDVRDKIMADEGIQLKPAEDVWAELK